MALTTYTIHCTHAGCRRHAAFKIAARWSDGITHELKTYALVCVACLPSASLRARTQRDACGLAAGETLEPPVIYELARGRRDFELRQRPDLEAAERP